jgi:hypothetical protein
MMYKARALPVLRSTKNTQRKASTMKNFWMLNLVYVKKTVGFKRLISTMGSPCLTESSWTVLFRFNVGKVKWSRFD